MIDLTITVYVAGSRPRVAVIAKSRKSYEDLLSGRAPARGSKFSPERFYRVGLYGVMKSAPRCRSKVSVTPLAFLNERFRWLERFVAFLILKGKIIMDTMQQWFDRRALHQINT